MSFAESSTFDSVIEQLIGIRHYRTDVFEALNSNTDDQIATVITNLFF